MDSNSDEQTELLRNIWNQMKQLDHNLGARIDGVRDEIVGLKQEVKEVKVEIVGLKQEMREVKQAVTELRGDMFDLRLEVKAVRVATQGTFELLGRDHGDLRKRVDRIEGHLGLPPPKRRH